MGLSIKNAGTVNKVRRLARLKRKGLTEVVDEAVSRELGRLHPAASRQQGRALAAIHRIQREYAAGRLAAKGTPEEIIGYNDKGHLD